MTTTTEPTTEPTTQAPAWLNLDALCPAEVRAEIAVLTAAFGSYLYEMEAEVKKARYLLKAIEAIHHETQAYLDAQGANGDLHELIMALTGAEGLWGALSDLSGAIDSDHADRPYPTDQPQEVED